jgi:hypothetical protein
MLSTPSSETTPCLVCGSSTVPHTVKRWGGTLGLGDVLMARCVRCGFVQAETIYAMSEERWERLNVECHSLYQGSDENPTDPRWLERMTAQRDVLAALHRLDLTPPGKPWLDWGAGDAKLSEMLRPECVQLDSFDAYMGGPDYLTQEDLKPRSFGLVISTSVFEHVRSLEPLDDMERLVADGGIFAIHTLIAEEVPGDPDWFYYQAPHVSFFTNDSMAYLFERWGYRSSVYHLPSKLWFCLKEPEERAREIAAKLNAETGTEDSIPGAGFVGYWTNARLGRPPGKA